MCFLDIDRPSLFFAMESLTGPELVMETKLAGQQVSVLGAQTHVWFLRELFPARPSPLFPLPSLSHCLCTSCCDPLHGQKQPGRDGFISPYSLQPILKRSWGRNSSQETGIWNWRRGQGRMPRRFSMAPSACLPFYSIRTTPRACIGTGPPTSIIYQ